MKNFKYIVIIFLYAIVSSCTTNEKIIDVEEQDLSDANACIGENLGVTKVGRFSKYWIDIDKGPDAIFELDQARWQWRVYNDTIEISGGVHSYLLERTDYHFFKLDGDCCKYLSSRIEFFDDNTNLNNPCASYIVSDENWGFSFQRFKKGKYLIGKMGGTQPIWMDFTEDNRLKTVPSYLSCYHG